MRAVRSLATFQLPKFEWVQSRFEFGRDLVRISAVLRNAHMTVHRELRDIAATLILTFGERARALRTLRILNDDREHLGVISTDRT